LVEQTDLKHLLQLAQNSATGDYMLIFRTSMAALILVFVTANIQAADLTGIWITEKSESVGIEIIKGMKKKSETSYKRGKIYAPDTKKWYKSKMTLQADDKLKVSGCVLGGVICRSQLWTRQKQ